MRMLIAAILFFPLMTMGQHRFNIIRERLMQDKTFENVYYFENNYAVFRTFDGKVGLIDSTGMVVLETNYSFISTVRNLRNLFEVGSVFNKKYKRGYIDLKGNNRIPIIYDQVYYVGGGLIRVVKDKKYGVLDTLNAIILPTEYDYVSFDRDLIITDTSGIKCLYDGKGKRIGNLRFTEISRFRNNKAIVVFENKSSAIIDTLGNIILGPIQGYRFEQILNEDLYLIKNEVNSKAGIVNGEGEFTIECTYDEIRQETSFFIAKNNDTYGFISNTDSILKPFDYDMVFKGYFGESKQSESVSFDESYVVRKNRLYGVVNPYLDNEIIPIQYKRITTLPDRYYIVENTENQNGLFLRNGDTVLNEEYVFYNTFGKTIFATKNNQQYLINLEKGNYSEIEVVADEFVKILDDFEYPRKANQIFKLNGKYGVVNYENNIIIPAEYDLIENDYLHDEFIVRKNNKCGIVNAENTIVVEIEYDEYKQGKSTILFTKENQAIRKVHEIAFGSEEPPRAD